MRCQKCDSEISESADKCPYCGYEPGDMGYKENILGLIAAVCFLSVVGVPIGALILWKLYRDNKRRGDWKPTTHAP